MRKRVLIGGAAAIAAVIGLGTAVAQSRQPDKPDRVVRVNGQEVRKGDVVATLRRDASGKCVTDGFEVVIEDLEPEENMGVDVATDEKTCVVTVKDIYGIAGPRG